MDEITTKQQLLDFIDKESKFEIITSSGNKIHVNIKLVKNPFDFDLPGESEIPEKLQVEDSTKIQKITRKQNIEKIQKVPNQISQSACDDHDLQPLLDQLTNDGDITVLDQIKTLEQAKTFIKIFYNQYKNSIVPNNDKNLHFLFGCASPLVIKDKSGNFQEFQPLQRQNHFDNIFGAINTTDRHLTIQKVVAYNLIDMLSQKPKILHILAHGALNSQVNIPASKGDVIILENAQDAVIQYQSEWELRKNMPQNQETKMVFLACCHSQRIGEVILQKGVGHVVCIRQQQHVWEKCLEYFSKEFYKKLIIDEKTICQAFKETQAQMLKSEDHDLQQQATYFILLNNNCIDCHKILPKSRGQIQNIGPKPKHIISNLRKASMVGRSIEMAQAINKLNTEKILNIQGSMAVGKKILANNLAYYYQERNRFSGGVIIINMENVSKIDVFIEKIYSKIKSQILIKGKVNSSLLNDSQSIVNDKLDAIIKYFQNLDLLLVFTSIQNLNLKDYKELIRRIYESCQSLKIITTSTIEIEDGFHQTYHFILPNMSNDDSFKLFFEMAKCLQQGKNDAKKIMSEYLNKQGDCNYYELRDELRENEIFELMSGNPMIIIHYAKKLDQGLKIQEIYQQLKNGESLLDSLRHSLESQFQVIYKTNQTRAMVLCLIGIMPDGISKYEIDQILKMKIKMRIIDKLIQQYWIQRYLDENSNEYKYKVVQKFMEIFLQEKVSNSTEISYKQIRNFADQYLLQIMQETYQESMKNEDQELFDQQLRDNQKNMSVFLNQKSFDKNQIIQNAYMESQISEFSKLNSTIWSQSNYSQNELTSRDEIPEVECISNYSVNYSTIVEIEQEMESNENGPAEIQNQGGLQVKQQLQIYYFTNLILNKNFEKVNELLQLSELDEQYKCKFKAIVKIEQNQSATLELRKAAELFEKSENQSQISLCKLALAYNYSQKSEFGQSNDLLFELEDKEMVQPILNKNLDNISFPQNFQKKLIKYCLKL